LKVERAKIAEEEGRKAKLLAATDLDQKAKEIADLRQSCGTNADVLARNRLISNPCH
jgi:hypothetical protein